MTIADASVITIEGVQAAAERLAPTLRDRATDIDAARSLPADLLDELVAAGCFHLLLPPSHGGAGAALHEAIDVLGTLARADASVGWLTMIGSWAWIDVAGLPRVTFDEVVGNGNLLAGVFSPSGLAEAVDDGYRVSGRWAFASGCGHAAWIYGNCIDQGGDEPTIRTAVLAADEVQIEDTWHVVGLRGTGSHHITVDGLVVPTERTATDADPRAIDTPILRIPPPAMFSLGVAAVALGTAQGALEEISTQAGERTPLLATNALVASPLFLHDLARTEAELRAARALIQELAADLWVTAEAGDPITLTQRAHTRAGAAWVAERARVAVGTAYGAGGGGAVYDENPLQRRLRDIHAISQHFLVRPDTHVTAGRALTGQELDVPVF